MSVRQEILAAKDEATPVDKYAAGRNAAFKLFASKAKFSLQPWKYELERALTLADKCSPGEMGSDLFWALKGFFDFWEGLRKDISRALMQEFTSKDVNELIEKDLCDRAAEGSAKEVNSRYAMAWHTIKGDYVNMFWPLVVARAGGKLTASQKEGAAFGVYASLMDGTAY